MKKNLLLVAGLLILSIAGFAQANLVVFSEDGDLFYAYINGIRQNDKPEANVKVTGITGDASVRIEFADKALPQLKQFMALEPGFEHTARIKRDMKKQLKLRYFGQVPLNEAPASGATSIQYHTAETPAYNTAESTTPNNSFNNNNTAVTSSTVTTKTSSGTVKATDNVSININMSGTGVNMNVNDPGAPALNTITSTTVTTTSYSTSSGHNSTINNNSNPKGHNNTTYNNQPVSNSGCRAAMPADNFAKVKQTVASKPFSDTKMSTARVATKNSCLSTAQVKELCKLFSMDDDKLAYAKYAYAFCVDKANYYQVSEVFSFSSTTDEFNKFLE